MTAVTQSRWRALPSQRAASALAGAALLLVLACAVLMGLTGNLSASNGGSTVALAVAFLTMGFLVARHQPRNPVGWVLIVTGLSTAFTTAAGLYMLLDYGSAHGSLPAGSLVFVGANTFWPSGIFAGMLAVGLFPDGRLTRRWRRAMGAYVAVCVLVLISQAIPAAAVVTAGDVAIAATDRLTKQPGGPAVQFLVSGLPVLAPLPFSLAWVIYQVSRYRRAQGDVRQQYKWFAAGAAAALLGIVVSTVAESGGNSGTAHAVGVAATYAILAFPLGMGVAVLKYRLYEIDRIISRTLAYAVVTGLLVGVYAGVAALAGMAGTLPFNSPIAVAVATLAAAALFNPLRRRVQKVVDRRFNRARYDADQVIAAFAGRLQDTAQVGTAHVDAAGADLLTTVQTALEPAHAAIWLAGVQR